MPVRADPEDLVESWASYLRAVDGLAVGTIGAYRRSLLALVADSKVERLEDLRRAQLEDHLKRLFYVGAGPGRIQQAILAARSFGRYLVAHGLANQNPADGIRGPRRYHKARKVLTIAEVRRLVTGPERRPKATPQTFAELRDRVMLAVAYAAALRSGEVGRIRVDDLEWQEEFGLFTVLIRDGKAAAGDRTVPLAVEVSTLLQAYLPMLNAEGPPSPFVFPSKSGKPLGRWDVSRIFRARCRAVGVEPAGRRLTPHVLRHSRATHLLEAGWSTRYVREMLRHASIATTELYLHVDEEKLARQLRRRDPLTTRKRAPIPDGRAFLHGILGELANLGNAPKA